MQHGRGAGVGCVGRWGRCCSRLCATDPKRQWLQERKVPFSVSFPGGSGGKASACSAGDPGSIPGSGRSPGEGNGNPLQYSCLENPMDRSVVGYSPPGCKELDTRLSDFTFFSHLEAWTESGALLHVVLGVSLPSGRSGPDTCVCMDPCQLQASLPLAAGEAGKGHLLGWRGWRSGRWGQLARTARATVVGAFCASVLERGRRPS